MADEFDRAMRLMRKRNPQLQEDGFAQLMGSAALHLPRLMRALDDEADIGVRRWLAELIASTGDERAMSLLEQCLEDGDESVRDWAVSGLERIDSRDARIALRRFRGEPIS